MAARPLMISLTLVALLLFGFALLVSLMKPEDSPLSDDDQGSMAATDADIYEALSDVAYFSVFGKLDGKSLSETAYVVEGLLRLAIALELLAQRDGLDTQGFDAPQDLRSAAEALRESRTPESSAIARDALTAAAAATTELQRRSYPHLARATATLNESAARLRTDQQLADQHIALAAYFDAVSDALMPMILVRR
jgi:hypothetical protein